jgi:hypothetical protein
MKISLSQEKIINLICSNHINKASQNNLNSSIKEEAKNHVNNKVVGNTLKHSNRSFKT